MFPMPEGTGKIAGSRRFGFNPWKAADSHTYQSFD